MGDCGTFRAMAGRTPERIAPYGCRHHRHNFPPKYLDAGECHRMSALDVHRFDSLSDRQVIRRIGSLLAVALMRSGALAPARATTPVRPAPAKPLERSEFLADVRDQRIVRYLECAGNARPRELAVALGLSRGVTQRRLLHLRATGVCHVVGMTRGARYSLQRDFTRN